MKKRNILIVSRAFYPVQAPRAFRAIELAKEIARKGHSVTVYTIDRDVDYCKYARETKIEIKLIGKMTFPSLPDIKNRFIRPLCRPVLKLLELLFHYPDIELTLKIPKALKHESGYDLMISIAYPYPIHWGCARAIVRNPCLCKTWAADCGDPFMGNKADRFGRPFYFAYLEKWFSRKADHITIPIEDAREAYYPEFHSKIRVIPQGFPIDNFHSKEQPIGNHAPTFAYAGLLMPEKRDPRPFLKYLDSLKIEFRFVMYARNTGFIESLIKQLGTKVEIHDYIERDELLSILSRMDFLVNIENTTTVQSPSKLIDYAIAGRPVLSVSSTSVDKKIVDQFLTGDYSGKRELPDLSQYDIRTVASQFIALCEHRNVSTVN
jgi:hypothetical protein